MNISDGWENVREEILNYQSVLLYDISAQNRNLILKYCYQKDKEIYMTSKISDVILRSSKDILLFDMLRFFWRRTAVCPGSRKRSSGWWIW